MLNSEWATLTDDALLDRFQRRAFDYFLETVNPQNGLVPDRSVANSPSSIAVVGFALSSYPVGVERGWVDRGHARDLTLAALRFFMESPQGKQTDATGHKGFYYHFLDMHTGRRAWNCELSMVDTALLMAGILTASAYFDRADDAETEIRSLADRLYRQVDWCWSQGRHVRLRQGWKPKRGFLPYTWAAFSEAMILYVLAMASPDHSVSDTAYAQWSATFERKTLYGQDVIYGGPLFVHQFSHAWIDFAGIQDECMRASDSDYFENSRRSVFLHHEYTKENPQKYAGYGDHFWGLSAGDGPGPIVRTIAGKKRRFRGYAARGAPFGPDDGTLAPWSCAASVPFAPELVLASLRHMCRTYPQVVADYGLPSGFNPTLGHRKPFGPEGWISDGRFGLDQGIVVMMIENYRSGLIWKLSRRSPIIRKGLEKAGFTGGWLTRPG